MRLLKPIVIVLLTLLFSCDDSINGPIGSNLTYEPQLVSVGEEVEFGTINEDLIKVKFVGLDGNSYIFEHSDHCPVNSNNTKLELNMCDSKYKVTFRYHSVKANSISLQLYKYEKL